METPVVEGTVVPDAAIAVYQHPAAQELAINRPPQEVLAEAALAATALKDVISKKPKPVIMNGETYLEFEDWQTIGRFYNVSPKCLTEPEHVTYGEVYGFKATSCVVLPDGREVGHATAWCLSDEEKWGSRPKYDYLYVCKDGQNRTEADSTKEDWVWEPNPNKANSQRPKKVKVQVGEEKVPLFQMASMAQTRANAKAMRNVLAFVTVLAGYKPTPAEEIADMAEKQQARPQQTQQTQPAQDNRPVPAWKRFHTEAGSRGFDVSCAEGVHFAFCKALGREYDPFIDFKPKTEEYEEAIKRLVANDIRFTQASLDMEAETEQPEMDPFATKNGTADVSEEAVIDGTLTEPEPELTKGKTKKTAEPQGELIAA